jgi:hypothetical protein
MNKLFCLLFCICSFWANAQNPTADNSHTDVALSSVLANLEQQFGVNFSYNAGLIKNKKISFQDSYTSLAAFLSILEDTLPIVFKKINETTFIIKKSSKIDVCGYVKETISGRPVENATISNSIGNSGTLTDTEGYFFLKNVRDSDTLTIQFIGYKSIQLLKTDFSNTSCPTFFLSEENYALNEVIVQEYLAPGVLKQRDGSIRITPQNLEILSGLSEPDVLQSTQLLPGIESVSETASGLFVRGGTPDQNLILWDGIKMYNTGHFFDMISVFNSYVVESVKVFRSGAGVQYGDRVSGVIDISTTSKIPKKAEGGFGLNLTHLDGFVNLPLSPKTGIQISARRSLTDVFETPTFRNLSNRVFQNTSIKRNQENFEEESIADNEQFYFYDTNFKINSEVSKKDKISFAGLLTRNNLNYGFSNSEFEESSSDILNVTNFGLNSTWKRDWTTTFSSKLELYYSK